MQDFTIPEHVTIESHRVSASYDVHGAGMSTAVGINGYTLKDIVNDLIDFFNGMEERAEEFAIWKVTNDDNGEFMEVIIKGWLARFDADHGYTDESDPVTVTVYAVQK